MGEDDLRAGIGMLLMAMLVVTSDVDRHTGGDEHE